MEAPVLVALAKPALLDKLARCTAVVVVVVVAIVPMILLAMYQQQVVQDLL
jgi:hypothetical protein